MYQLRNALRSGYLKARGATIPIQRKRIRACGYAIVADGGMVGLVASAEGKVRYQGLAHCGSVWECPCCMMVIKAGRAEEIRHVVECHGRERCVLVSLTLRHGAGDNLEHLRTQLADAWRGMTRGKAWTRFKSRYGVSGTIRALELTHGEANGWHPHLHVLLLLDEAPPAAELVEFEGKIRWECEAVTWLGDRWATMVGRHVDEQDKGRERYGKHVPTMLRGCVVTPCNRGDYLSKLGLELSDPGNKKARSNKGRTPLQIAADYEETGSTRDGWLWRFYCQAMKGARQLTWSRGLKRCFDIVDRTDQEVAQDEEPSTPDEVVIGKLSADEWAAVRSGSVEGTCGTYYVIRCAERHGAPGLRKAVRRLCEQDAARRKAV